MNIKEVGFMKKTFQRKLRYIICHYVLCLCPTCKPDSTIQSTSTVPYRWTVHGPSHTTCSRAATSYCYENVHWYSCSNSNLEIRDSDSSRQTPSARNEQYVHLTTDNYLYCVSYAAEHLCLTEYIDTMCNVYCSRSVPGSMYWYAHRTSHIVW